MPFFDAGPIWSCELAPVGLGGVWHNDDVAQESMVGVPL